MLAGIGAALAGKPLPPVVVGGAIIVPVGLLAGLQGEPTPPTFAADTERSERLAMAAVMESERRLGFGFARGEPSTA